MTKLPYAVIFSKINNCDPILYIDEINRHDNTRISGIPIDSQIVIMFNGSIDECIEYCEKYAKTNKMFKHIIPYRTNNGLAFDIHWKIRP